MKQIIESFDYIYTSLNSKRGTEHKDIRLVVFLYYFFDDRVAKKIANREDEVTELIDEGKRSYFRWYNINYRSNKKYKSLTKGLSVSQEPRK